MAKVTLKVMSGSLSNTRWDFDRKTRLLVGRQVEGGINVPPDYPNVSRLHCVFEIDPPYVKVRDHQSLNGTFLNAQCIGQAATNLPAGSSAAPTTHFILKHGDEVSLSRGSLTFRIEIDASGGERERDRNRAGAHAGQPSAPPHCLYCRREVDPGLVVNRDGTTICPRCKGKAPGESLKQLLASETARAEIFKIRSYEVHGSLAAPHSNRVYKALDKNLRPVVLKGMKITEENTLAHCLREMRVMKALNHPHVVRFLEDSWHDEKESAFFLVMEYCNRGSLHDFAHTHHRATGRWLPHQLAVFFIAQALEGLHYLHHDAVLYHELTEDGSFPRGIVHRDIKPANLLLCTPYPASASLLDPFAPPPVGDESLIVKIADFGISKGYTRAGKSGLTKVRDRLGTAHFISREQFQNYLFAGPEVDVWSMAATLYWLLSGSPSRDFSGARSRQRGAELGNAVPLLKRAPRVPGRLASLIDEVLREPRSKKTDPALLTAAGFRAALLQSIR